MYLPIQIKILISKTIILFQLEELIYMHPTGSSLQLPSATCMDSPCKGPPCYKPLPTSNGILPPAQSGAERHTLVNDIEHGIGQLCLQKVPTRSALESKSPCQYAQFEYFGDRKSDRKEIEKLRCKIAKDSENITIRFATLVLGIYRLLSRKQVPVEEIRIAVRYLGCYRNPPERNAAMFGSSSDITQAKDLAQLIECLHNYSSWFNYRLLKYVAVEFGGDEGRSLIDDYEDDLRIYFENLIIYMCPDFSLTKGIPPGFEQLVIKVDWDYRSCSIQAVTQFQANLSELMGLEPHVFQLKTVEEGCVCPHVHSRALG